MNKFKFNMLLSLSAAALCTTLLYQNCAKQKYTQEVSNGVSGALGSLDSGGFLPVEVIVDNCSTPSDLEKPICQEPVTLNLYVEEGANRTKIDSIEALPKILEEDGVQVVKYVAKFQVNISDYECKTLVVTQVTDLGEVDIGKVKVPGDACEEIGDGTFKIDSIVQDNKLIEVNGTCVGSAKVNFSGNINANATKDADCSNAKFNFCSYSTKFGLNNTVTATQGSNTDSKTVLGAGTSTVFITLDKTSFNPATASFSGQGRCTPGGDIKLLIYNRPTNVGKCDNSGNWSYSNSNWLVTTLTNRELTISISHSLGSMQMITNIDSASTPNCAINSKIAHPTMCVAAKNAGTIKGSCLTGLPIELKVNGVGAGIKICQGGAYEFKGVLLTKRGMANKVSVHQIQTGPNGLVSKCDKEVTMSNF